MPKMRRERVAVGGAGGQCRQAAMRALWREWYGASQLAADPHAHLHIGAVGVGAWHHLVAHYAHVTPYAHPAVHAYLSQFGRQGGRARMRTLTPERRREIAQAACAARWARRK